MALEHFEEEEEEEADFATKKSKFSMNAKVAARRNTTKSGRNAVGKPAARKAKSVQYLPKITVALKPCKVSGYHLCLAERGEVKSRRVEWEGKIHKQNNAMPWEDHVRSQCHLQPVEQVLQDDPEGQQYKCLPLSKIVNVIHRYRLEEGILRPSFFSAEDLDKLTTAINNVDEEERLRFVLNEEYIAKENNL
ncbi:hypothetical protein HK101_011964 [Irineochytrium annulatum]|nr:hypothetical protein HK101_011964 [Irineochytrium annulatum]